MRKHHSAACEEFFQFFNSHRDQNTEQSVIDLHGLLVADEKKLQDYRQQHLCGKKLTGDEVDEKIKEERNHGNEAIRYCSSEPCYLLM